MAEALKQSQAQAAKERKSLHDAALTPPAAAATPLEPEDPGSSGIPGRASTGGAFSPNGLHPRAGTPPQVSRSVAEGRHVHIW